MFRPCEAVIESPGDNRGDGDFAGRTGGYDRSRHAGDHAARWALHQNRMASRGQSFCSFAAIASHAAQDDADDRAIEIGNAGQQYVAVWMEGRGAIPDSPQRQAARSHDHRMICAAPQQDDAMFRQGTGLADEDGVTGNRREMVRNARRMLFGDM